jgi:hypothetical protein
MAARGESQALSAIARAFDRAARPDTISAGICLAYDTPPRDRWPHPDRVRAVVVRAADSGGAAWERHLAERLWRGEDFVLHLDADTSLVRGWDDSLRAQWLACGQPRAILSAMPPEEHDPPAARLCASHFRGRGALVVARAPTSLSSVDPVPQAFLSDRLLSAPSALLREVPRDPLLGDPYAALAYMVRAWTHGWDFYAPALPVAFGGADSSTAHSSAAGSVSRRDRARAWHLLGLAATRDLDALDRLGAYALGSERSLAQYERFAGIRLAEEFVSRRARAGVVNPRASQPRAEVRADESPEPARRRSPRRAPTYA